MGVDYAVQGVYGVVPEGPFFQRFLELLEEEFDRMALDKDEFDADEDEHESAAQLVFSMYPELLEELQGQYNAPLQAKMFWTGSVDYRAGRCDTDPEEWVFGVGLFQLHERFQMSEQWMQQAQYMTWVEVY